MRKTSKKRKKKNAPRFHCKSEAQKKAIRRAYAIRAKKERETIKFPHFRYYLKSGHPALILGEQQKQVINEFGEEKLLEEYRFRKVTHSEKEGSRNNEKVYPNPDPSDPDPMYIIKRVRHDLKSNFENEVLPWVYPSEEQ